MDDKVYSFTKKIIAQVADEQDKYLKDVIIKYAQEQAKKLGEQIEVLFIDKAVADEIISLGIREYMKFKNIN